MKIKASKSNQTTSGTGTVEREDANGHKRSIAISSRLTEIEPRRSALTLTKPVKTKQPDVVEAAPTTRLHREPTQEAVEQRAYELWLERGGNEVVNWLEAEAELRANAKD